MVDNVQTNPGVGGAVFASDDIGGIQYPRVKVTFGDDGAATDASATNPLPVGLSAGQIASLAPLATQPISAAALPLPSGAATETTLAAVNTKLGLPLAVTGTFFPATQPVSASALPLPAGAATETTLAAASAKLPSALGQQARAASISVALATENEAEIGALTETAPLTDTASSGLNGRLQRIAQRLSSLISLLPAALGRTTMAGSMSVAVASDQASIPVTATQALGTAATRWFAQLSDGTNSPAISAANGLAVDVTRSVPLSLTTGPAAQSALNVNLIDGVASSWTDVSAFRQVAVQIIGGTGITAGAITLEVSNDGTNAIGLSYFEPAASGWTASGIATIAASTARLFVAQINAKFFRIRISTAFTGGTVQAVLGLSAVPNPLSIFTNPNATATLMGDVGLQARANATGAATVSSVLSPATPAATSLKASAGRILAYDLFNSATTLRSVKIFNVAAPTLGTTAAAYEIDIPASGRASLAIPVGNAHTTAIVYSVTSAKGLTDNTATGLAANDVSGFIAWA